MKQELCGTTYKIRRPMAAGLPVGFEMIVIQK